MIASRLFWGIWLAGDYLYSRSKINKQHQLFLKNKAEESRDIPVAGRTRYDKDAEEEFQLEIRGSHQVCISCINEQTWHMRG